MSGFHFGYMLYMHQKSFTMKNCFQFRRRKNWKWRKGRGKIVPFWTLSIYSQTVKWEWPHQKFSCFFQNPWPPINLIWRDILVHTKYLLPKNMFLSESGLLLPRKKGRCTTLMNTEAVGYWRDYLSYINPNYQNEIKTRPFIQKFIPDMIVGCAALLPPRELPTTASEEKKSCWTLFTNAVTQECLSKK